MSVTKSNIEAISKNAIVTDQSIIFHTGRIGLQLTLSGSRMVLIMGSYEFRVKSPKLIIPFMVDGYFTAIESWQNEKPPIYFTGNAILCHGVDYPIPELNEFTEILMHYHDHVVMSD